ncbi:hypothetical protein DPMN_132964 [Dreissena polymorpha]|uniref:Uncharacterized protein n=1 Tax=Dreissena polymorpha TaxID=45954 RepID=A0A9D4FUS2_DREPO|nr:hypothetical protein DPMN_132964 [Dreissena polymorpha]
MGLIEVMMVTSEEAELVSGVVSESEHKVLIEVQVTTWDQLVMLELIHKTLRGGEA